MATYTSFYSENDTDFAAAAEASATAAAASATAADADADAAAASATAAAASAAAAASSASAASTDADDASTDADAAAASATAAAASATAAASSATTASSASTSATAAAANAASAVTTVGAHATAAAASETNAATSEDAAAASATAAAASATAAAASATAADASADAAAASETAAGLSEAAAAASALSAAGAGAEADAAAASATLASGYATNAALAATASEGYASAAAASAANLADFEGIEVVSDVASNNNNTSVPTTAAVKAYADSVGGGGGGGTPGGSDTQVQFNDGGSFGGDAAFTFDAATDTLAVGGRIALGGSATDISLDSFPTTFQNAGNPATNWLGTFVAYGNNNSTPAIAFAKTKGATPATQGAVVDTNALGSYWYYGSDGTNFVRAVRENYFVDGAVSTGVVPSAYNLFLTDTSGNFRQVYKISGAGRITLANGVDPGITITGSTVTASTPLLNLSQTWNNAAAAFTGILANYTVTAATNESRFFDFQVGGTSRLDTRYWNTGTGAVTTRWKNSSGTAVISIGVDAADQASFSMSSPSRVGDSAIIISSLPFAHGLFMQSDSQVVWTDDTTYFGTPVLGLRKDAAGVLAVDDGAYGSTVYRDIKARAFLLSNGSDLPERLTANRTYYVRTDGNDSNDGLSDTSGGAFLTLDGAMAVIKKLDFAGYDVTMSLQASQSWTSTFTVIPWSGGGRLILDGNAGSISVAAGIGIRSLNGTGEGTLLIQDVTISSLIGISINAGRVVIGDNVTFGSATGSHINVYGLYDTAYLGFYSAYTISGGASSHISAGSNAFVEYYPGTVTLSGTPAFTNFIYAETGANVDSFGVTFSGSATGRRFYVDGGATRLAPTSATYWPGNTAGVVTGFARRGTTNVLSFSQTSEKTIASGVIDLAAVGMAFTVDTESDAASDDLDTITATEEFDGHTVVLRAADSGRTVVVKNGTGNIYCGADRTLDNIQDTIVLMYSSAASGWLLLAFNDNGA